MKHSQSLSIILQSFQVNYWTCIETHDTKFFPVVSHSDGLKRLNPYMHSSLATDTYVLLITRVQNDNRFALFFMEKAQ
jgi:hypothetical protein